MSKTTKHFKYVILCFLKGVIESFFEEIGGRWGRQKTNKK
jgi:hypothetical protein